ncbi:hypothetical protein DI392_00775 [Vibrio albus]|uniref:Peptidase n=1 Tax=Vibrio albus TaxID=2200953 RepID=A0A2U3BDJ4_9VIBR|nr:hypothetical protein DI392_00775 [Vibrio albus]
MKPSRTLKTIYAISSALFLSPLLTSCASPTETVVQTEYILPPAGLVVPCEKPAVIGTWPEVVTEDIPKLKSALGECATQADEYLKWRKQREDSG